VRYSTPGGRHELRARLIVGADGRFSKVRRLAGLEAAVSAAQPFDLLWFRLPRHAGDPSGGVYLGDGGWLVMLNRGAEWQIAFSLPKGGYQRLRASGIDALRRSIGVVVPWLAERAGALRDWKQTSLLVVEVSRLRRWYRPGLLLIGDAAHTMSPVAGVGISVALQDAAVAANLLAPSLRASRSDVRALAAVQRRREPAVRIVQAYQALAQRCLLSTGRGQPGRIPLPLRLQGRLPLLRDLTARVFGLGVWPIRLEPPQAAGSVATCSPGRHA
jgi:2-polyprenyl-6-methoxyphenol hydroxylase-like FAD-dependent oxidoreductase